MKISPGEYAPVTATAPDIGRQFRWTEPLQSVEVTQEPMALFHSHHRQVTAFRARRTCFYEGYTFAGHIYLFRPPPGTKVYRYPGREVRVELQPGMALLYLGEYIAKYEDIRPGWVREIVSYTGLCGRYLDEKGHAISA